MTPYMHTYIFKYLQTCIHAVRGQNPNGQNPNGQNPNGQNPNQTKSQRTKSQPLVLDVGVHTFLIYTCTHGLVHA